MRLEESVEINRPLEEVFKYVADVGNYPDWMAHVLEVRQDSPAHHNRAIASSSLSSPSVAASKPPTREPRTRLTGGIRIEPWVGRFLTSGGTLPFRRYQVGRASRELWRLSRVACSSCWSRFRSGRPSAN